VTWYRLHASAQVSERATRWGDRLHVQPREVLIRDPQRRWGSCDASGALRFNWRIIQAPPALVDYVVVHELVHLLHRHHTPGFWAALGRIIPDYETLRTRLRIFGPALVW
jgi:hypothetical protein